MAKFHSGFAALIGRPNVGKSTVFNRMVGERISIVDDTPGVTRDRIYGKCEWLTKDFNVIDTGGLQIADQPFQIEIKAQVEVAIEEADTVVIYAETDVHLLVRRLLGEIYKDLIVMVADLCLFTPNRLPSFIKYSGCNAVYNETGRERIAL